MVMRCRKLPPWIKQNIFILFSVSFTTFYFIPNYFLGTKSIDIDVLNRTQDSLVLNFANYACHILLINLLVSYDLLPIWI